MARGVRWDHRHSAVAPAHLAVVVGGARRPDTAWAAQGEEASKARERRRDQLIETLAELLAKADPQVDAQLDYGRAVTLIHRAQLLLGLRHRGDASLNAALNRLGYQLQAYIAVQDRPREARANRLDLLLTAQSEVTMAARVVIHAGVGLAAT